MAIPKNLKFFIAIFIGTMIACIALAYVFAPAKAEPAPLPAKNLSHLELYKTTPTGSVSVTVSK
jgi:accessory gene regulator protein AgrB